mgnify:CR=1 FL=1
MVLPTRVGMVPGLRIGDRADSRSPHPRGDGPCSSSSARRKNLFSPPAWGWSSSSGLPWP